MWQMTLNEDLANYSVTQHSLQNKHQELHKTGGRIGSQIKQFKAL